MQPTVRTVIDNPRVFITVYMRCLLERLAKAAKMDGILEETRRRSTWTGKQVTDLAKAFVAENFSGFEETEILEIFSWYASLRFDTTEMAYQVIRYFRQRAPGNMIFSIK